MQLTSTQTAAVELSTTSTRCIITGGAGTGKTTVIRTIIDRLHDAGNENIVLCAPTGKAAARITEATGVKAHTVHSACGIFPVDDSDEIGRNERPSLASSATTLIVDEASMLDDAVLAALCKTIKKSCRLILVGDPNQLPPVGAGYPFRDLIASGRVPHVHLDKCHRQAGKLLHNCYAILEGNSDDLVYDAGKGNRVDADWSFIECADEQLPNLLVKIFSGNNCLEGLGIPAEELLVLTPLNKGDCGRVELNRVIQKVYHESRGKVAPAYKEKAGGWDQFAVGDRVIWGKNNKELGLVNGDVGRVVSVGDSKIVVDFDGIGQKTVDTGASLNLAWVLTCHKAQGSQYRKVLVLQADKHCNGFLSGIVNRSWVYTAATRSQEATIFAGSARAFKKHLATRAVDRRETLLSRLVA
jgi:exodeoxyribonuclease V alpha subunit